MNGVIPKLKSIDKDNTPKPKLTIKVKKGYCNHSSVEVDTNLKCLQCTSCKAIIYPFDYILQIAYAERDILYQIKELKTQIQNLKLEKNTLEKEVRNLKAKKNRINL